MKHPLLALHSTFLMTAVAFLVLGPGCAKQEEPPAEAPPPPPPAEPAAPSTAQIPVSAEKNSFKEVTSHLDPGGSFYLYWGTEKILNELSAKVLGLQNLIETIGEIPASDRAVVQRAFGIAARLIKNSGVEAISGLGTSSIAREPGFYQSKFMVHHYRGQNSGFIWSLFGMNAHPLSGMDLLPATTALASFSDFDLGQLWSAVTNEIAQAGFAAAQSWVQSFPAEFQQATKIELNQLLGSLGGEYGLILTLDDSKQVPIPMGTQALQVPEPGLLLALKVKDDTIFDRIDQLLTENPQTGKLVVKSDKEGLRMRTLPVPLPLPVALRPSLARAGDYLLIATTDALIEEALAVKRGEKKGWKHSEEFKRLSQGTPNEGNQFLFLSQRFGQMSAKLQQQALRMNPQVKPGQMESLQKLFGGGDIAYTYVVGANTEEGWLAVGNGNQSFSQALLAPAFVFPAGVLAGIAVPSFVKAREKAQRAAILNNLEKIRQAKEQWAQENKKREGDLPSESDLAPFLPGGKIRNARGETYNFNAIGKTPVALLPDGSSITLP
ncbi:MAG: hypothetical protein HY735_37560 [Verrucomicrobia bacterium]|nr:hypothetical protein [Verrucomicrobiota bacterium]